MTLSARSSPSSSLARSRLGSIAKTRYVLPLSPLSLIVDADEDVRVQILKAKETDQRAALFARAIKSGQEMQAANRKLLLRMRLYVYWLSLSQPLESLTGSGHLYRQQADLVVKAPKGQMGSFHGYIHPSDMLNDHY